MEWWQDGWTLGPVMFDRVSGIGNTPFGMEIDYRGAIAMMRPSTFLSLVTPPEMGDVYVGKMVSAIAGGKPVAMPQLTLRDDGEGGTWVCGHEGRSRMRSVAALCGDEEVPVALFVLGRRASWMDDTFLASVCSGVRRETSDGPGEMVDGPLFTSAHLSGRLVETRNHAPGP